MTASNKHMEREPRQSPTVWIQWRTKRKRLELREKWKEQGEYIILLASNVYCLTIKTELVEFYHEAARWPVKKA